MKANWLPLLLTIFAAIIAATIAFHQPLLSAVGRFPVHEDDLHPSDLIVVISGGLPEIKYGVDLYHQGYGETILFVGHFPVQLVVLSREPFDVMEESWEVIARQLAENAGVAPDDIRVTTLTANSTLERVAHALEVARQEEALEIIVVSGPLHSRRIAQSAARLLDGRPAKVKISPVSPAYYQEGYRYDPMRWWQDEFFIKEVFSEYVKLLYYAFKYR